MNRESQPSKLSRRRFLQSAAALSGMAALAACTPTGSAPAESGGGGGSGEAPAILLRLNGIDPPGQEFADKFVADYNTENNVAIEIDYTDWGSSFQKATTGLALSLIHI